MAGLCQNNASNISKSARIRPEVALCGWQDVQLQKLTSARTWIFLLIRPTSSSSFIFPNSVQTPAWFGHVTRHDSLSRTILKDTLEGGQHHGWQKKCWMDNIKEWTSLPMPELLTRASCRKRLEEHLCWIIRHVPPTTQLVKGLNWTELNFKHKVFCVLKSESYCYLWNTFFSLLQFLWDSRGIIHIFTVTGVEFLLALWMFWARKWTSRQDTGSSAHIKWVGTHGSICTAPKHFALRCFPQQTRPRALFTVLLGQAAGLSKGACLYEGADWLSSSARS